MSNRIKHAVVWTAVLGFGITLACAAPRRCMPPDAPSVEAGALLDEDAAFKVARDFGLRDGLAEWSAELNEYPQYGLAWYVSNTLHDGADGSSGQGFVIDACTGVLLDTTTWHFQWFTE